MIRHYLTWALRNVRRAPLSTGINVFTLALGLTCFVAAYGVIGFWAQSERGFANSGRIHAVAYEMEIPGAGVRTGPQTNAPAFFADYLRLDIPELEAIARTIPAPRTQVRVGDVKTLQTVTYADPDFLKIFDLPFSAGDAASAMAQPRSVILSSQTAERLFGEEAALGRPILIDGRVEATVTGVFGEIDGPSHMGRDDSASLPLFMIASWDIREQLVGPAPATPGPNDWTGAFCCNTYMLLPEDGGLSAAALRARLAGFVEQRMPQELRDFVRLTVGAVPVNGMMANTLNARLFAGVNIDISITGVLLTFGVLVLSVACVNYANLATAQAIARSREVGLRKAMGADRRRIAAQYLVQAGVLTAAAMAVSVLLILLAAPVLRSASGIDISLPLFSGAGFWLFLLSVLAGVTLAAGAYPALYLSGMRPLLAVRARAATRGALRLSRLLVGFQFAAASFLLIMMMIVLGQNAALRRSGVGEDGGRLVIVANRADITGLDSAALAQDFASLPQVQSVSTMRLEPWGPIVNLMPFSIGADAAASQQTSFNNSVGYDFFETMGMRVLAGRTFDRDRAEDSAFAGFAPEAIPTVVVDRSFAREFGFVSPEMAVGQTIYVPLGDESAPRQSLRIIGVVEDRPLSLRGLGATSSMYFLGAGHNYLLARLNDGETADGLAALQAAWDRRAPDYAFTYEFLDTAFGQSFALFGRVTQIFAGLSLVTFIISTIGLIGLSVHTISRRLREIGVRKTLGSSRLRVLRLMLWEFSKPVLIANLLAWPLAFMAAQAYLSVFIQRTPLTPAPFIAGLTATLAIAILAVAGQTWRAAGVQPARVLKIE